MREFIWRLIWKQPQDICRFCKADLYNCSPCSKRCVGRIVNRKKGVK